MSEVDIKQGLKNVLTKIQQACAKRKKEFEGVKPRLVAASKTRTADEIVIAYEEGQRHFGENYVQELEEKANKKTGIAPNEVVNLVKFVITECPNLQFDGLMTIGQYGYNPEDGPNPDYLKLLKCREDVCQALNLSQGDIELSMGMSNDYEQAIELGSTHVRVGVAIFGPRLMKTQ